MSRDLLTRDQVAKRLGYSLGTFYGKTKELAQAGFPAPVFGRMSGARWDPTAIDAWLDARLPAMPAGAPAPADADLAAAAAELDRRSEALRKH